MRRIVRLSLGVVDRRTDLSLSAFLLDRDLRVDSPVEPLAFLVTFDESVVLAEVVSNARLPTTSRSLELVPRVFLLNVVVDLLKIHLTRSG